MDFVIVTTGVLATLTAAFAFAKSFVEYKTVIAKKQIQLSTGGSGRSVEQIALDLEKVIRNFSTLGGAGLMIGLLIPIGMLFLLPENQAFGAKHAVLLVLAIGNIIVAQTCLLISTVINTGR